MDNQLTFFVGGEPRPQARPRLYKGRVYSPKSDWRKLVESHAYEQIMRRNNLTFRGAIDVDVVYYFKRPAIHFRSGKSAHLMKDDAPLKCTNRYDLDNLNKAILDAMTDAQLIEDDRFVVALCSSKIWENHLFEQGVSIRIRKCL